MDVFMEPKAANSTLVPGHHPLCFWITKVNLSKAPSQVSLEYHYRLPSLRWLPRRPHLLETDRKYLPFIKCVITANHIEPQEHCTEAKGQALGIGNNDHVIPSDPWLATSSSSAPHTTREKTESTSSLLSLSRMKKEKKNEHVASKHMSALGFQGSGNNKGRPRRHQQVIQCRAVQENSRAACDCGHVSTGLVRNWSSNCIAFLKFVFKNLCVVSEHHTEQTDTSTKHKHARRACKVSSLLLGVRQHSWLLSVWDSTSVSVHWKWFLNCFVKQQSHWAHKLTAAVVICARLVQDCVPQYSSRTKECLIRSHSYLRDHQRLKLLGELCIIFFQFYSYFKLSLIQ